MAYKPGHSITLSNLLKFADEPNQLYFKGKFPVIFVVENAFQSGKTGFQGQQSFV